MSLESSQRASLEPPGQAWNMDVKMSTCGLHNVEKDEASCIVQPAQQGCCDRDDTDGDQITKGLSLRHRHPGIPDAFKSFTRPILMPSKA